MTTLFADEISQYSQSIFANISKIKELKMHPKFQSSQRVFGTPLIFVATKINIPKKG